MSFPERCCNCRATKTTKYRIPRRDYSGHLAVPTSQEYECGTHYFENQQASLRWLICCHSNGTPLTPASTPHWVQRPSDGLWYAGEQNMHYQWGEKARRVMCSHTRAMELTHRYSNLIVTPLTPEERRA